MEARLKELPDPPWVPINGPQAMVWLSEANEVFFGGSAGGGKSFALLGMAMTCQTRSLILRKEATQLRQLHDDLMAIKGPEDHWRSVGYGGILETHDGRMLELSGCENFQSAEKYRGRAHDAKFFDEAPQLGEQTFRFVKAWCRTDDPEQRCRSIITGNPPTRPEEEWVIRYWAPWLDPRHGHPAEPGELRWFTTIDGQDVEVETGTPFIHAGEQIRPLSRTFIPARLSDNPILEATGYRAALQGLPEPLRSQLLYGDMSAGRADDEWQLIPTSWVREAQRRWKDNGDREGSITQGKRKRISAAALDCAMEGEDRMALAKLYDRWVAPLMTWPGVTIHTGNDIVQKVFPHLEMLQMPLLVDVLATAGGSAVQALRTDLPKAKVVAINFGAGSDFKDKSGRLEMANLRAEAYWRLREALDPSLGPPHTRLALPDDPELLSEICSIRWQPRSGKVQLEKKDEIRKRLGRSPDKADAVAMLLLAERPVDGGWVSDEPKKHDSPWVVDNRSPYGPGAYSASRDFMGIGRE